MTFIRAEAGLDCRYDQLGGSLGRPLGRLEQLAPLGEAPDVKL